MAAKILLLTLVILFQGSALNAQTVERIFRPTIDSDGVQRVEITGGSYYFDPNYIIVKVNVPVKLTLKKTPGITPHDFVINAPEAGINIRENLSTKPKTVTFTPVKTGRFDFYCDKRFLFFKSHREKGMEGILEVVE